MLWKKTPEDIAAREEQRHAVEEQRKRAREEAEEHRQAKEFEASPAGKAKAARGAGAQTYQITLPLSSTTGSVIALFGGTFSTTSDRTHGSVLDSIEAQGWHLEHAGYVFRMTGSVSRDKFMSSGQQEAVSGEILGIYIFRRRD